MPRPPSAASIIRNSRKQQQRFEPKAPIASAYGGEMFLPNHSGVTVHREFLQFLLDNYLKLDGSNKMGGNSLFDTDSTYNIGSSTNRVLTGFFDAVSVNALLVLGSTANIIGDMIPFADNGSTIGKITNRWNNIKVGTGESQFDGDIICNGGLVNLGEDVGTSSWAGDVRLRSGGVGISNTAQISLGRPAPGTIGWNAFFITHNQNANVINITKTAGSIGAFIGGTAASAKMNLFEVSNTDTSQTTANELCGIIQGSMNIAKDNPRVYCIDAVINQNRTSKGTNDNLAFGSRYNVSSDIATAGTFGYIFDGTCGSANITGLRLTAHASQTSDLIDIDSKLIIDKDSNLDTTERISSGTLMTDTTGPTDDLDVSGVNTVFIDATSNAVTIGGFVGGVNGQILHIVKCCATANNVTLEHNEGGGSQDIFLHAGADETLNAEYGGWTLVCNGSDWFDASHARHV